MSLTLEYLEKEETLAPQLSALIEKIEQGADSSPLTGGEDSLESYFSKLDHLITTVSPSKAAEMLDQEIQDKMDSLRTISRQGEARLEKFYADQIISRTESASFMGASPEEKSVFLLDLTKSFFRAVSYQKMVEAELKLLHQITIKPMDKLVIVGSGALPLSALLFQIHADATITCLEQDPEAVQKSQKLISKLEKMGLIREGSITILHEQPETFRYHNYDTVVLNAEVRNETKEKIFHSIDHDYHSVTAIAIRTAEDLAQLVYPPTFVLTEINRRLKFRGKVTPKRRDVHSLLTATYEPGQMETLIGDVEILTLTQIYLAPENTKSLKSAFRTSIGSSSNWSEKNAVAPNTRPSKITPCGKIAR